MAGFDGFRKLFAGEAGGAARRMAITDRLVRFMAEMGRSPELKERVRNPETRDSTLQQAGLNPAERGIICLAVEGDLDALHAALEEYLPHDDIPSRSSWSVQAFFW
jgi:hypothetical protein